VEGLAGNKRVIIAISRGGFYGAGTRPPREHLETYLHRVQLHRIANPEIIIAEVSGRPEHREKALESALTRRRRLQRRENHRASPSMAEIDPSPLLRAKGFTDF